MATGRIPTTANSPLTVKGDLFGYSTTQARVPVGNDGETLVADSSTSTGLRYQGNFAAGKNKIINGDFGVWQRGTSFSNPVNNTYLADRWYLGFDGTSATNTLSQQTFTPGTAPVAGYEGQYFFRWAKTAAGSSNTYNVIGQKIENCQTFAGQTITYSFWAKADTTRTITVDTEQYTNPTLSYTTSSSHNLTTSWQRFTATVTVSSLTGKTIGTGNYLAIRFSLPANTTYTIDIWGVQMEAGSTATAFQTATGTIQGELAACQRYYEPIFGGGSGGAYTSTQAIVNCPFKVEKRTAPTLVTLTANCNLVQSNAAYIVSTTGAYSIYAANGGQAFAVLITGLSGMTANYPVMLTNMSAAPFAASSEL